MYRLQKRGKRTNRRTEGGGTEAERKAESKKERERDVGDRTISGGQSLQPQTSKGERLPRIYFALFFCISLIP